MKVPFQGRTTYYDTFCFVESCFGLWFDGCTCKKSGTFRFVSHPSLSRHFRFTSLLGLDFSAMISPVVHIGAIAVSFLFVVMMFHMKIAETHEEVLRYLPVSGIIGLILWWEMFFILDNETIPLLPTQRNTTSLRYTVHAGKVRSWTNLETLGHLLYTYYSVWFLVPSLILLVAMIGAIVLTMHRTTKVKRQDVFRRNAIDSRRTIMRRTTDPLTID
nr:NADH dehydrogenase subunit 6 [Coptis chinensis]